MSNGSQNKERSPNGDTTKTPKGEELQIKVAAREVGKHAKVPRRQKTSTSEWGARTNFGGDGN